MNSSNVPEPSWPGRGTSSKICGRISRRKAVVVISRRRQVHSDENEKIADMMGSGWWRFRLFFFVGFLVRSILEEKEAGRRNYINCCWLVCCQRLNISPNETFSGSTLFPAVGQPLPEFLFNYRKNSEILTPLKPLNTDNFALTYF